MPYTRDTWQETSNSRWAQIFAFRHHHWEKSILWPERHTRWLLHQKLLHVPSGG